MCVLSKIEYITYERLLLHEKVYSWHNLLENSDDEPSIGELVLYACRDYEDESTNFYIIETHGQDTFDIIHDNGMYVIAWKYLDKFEG